MWSGLATEGPRLACSSLMQSQLCHAPLHHAKTALHASSSRSSAVPFNQHSEPASKLCAQRSIAAPETPATTCTPRKRPAKLLHLHCGLPLHIYALGTSPCSVDCISSHDTQPQLQAPCLAVTSCVKAPTTPQHETCSAPTVSALPKLIAHSTQLAIPLDDMLETTANLSSSQFPLHPRTSQDLPVFPCKSRGSHPLVH